MKYIEVCEIKTTAIVTVARETAMNALNLEVLKELEQVFEGIDSQRMKSVIITGKGKKSFVAGADIACMKEFTKAQAKDFSIIGSGTFRKIEMFPIPVIAAINGYALGGGLELALACDIRIASENAVFGLPESSFGIIPGFGGTQRLMRTIPVGSAKEMVYTGAKIDSTKALQLGLISSVFQREELMENAMIIARRIDRNSVDAIKFAKVAMNDGMNEGLKTGLEIEPTLFADCFERNEQVNRMSAFLKKERR